MKIGFCGLLVAFATIHLMEAKANVDSVPAVNKPIHENIYLAMNSGMDIL